MSQELFEAFYRDGTAAAAAVPSLPPDFYTGETETEKSSVSSQNKILHTRACLPSRFLSLRLYQLFYTANSGDKDHLNKA